MRRVWQRYSRSSTSLSAPIAPRWLRICSRGMGRRRRLRSRPCSPRSVREYVSTSVRQYVSTPVRQYASTPVRQSASASQCVSVRRYVSHTGR